MIKKELACVRRLAPGSKQSQSTHVLHICRRLAASWDKLGGLSAEPRGTGQARHHRLGQTAGMRRQRRLGGSSPSRATAMGQRVRILTGKGVCFPQTSHSAQAKMPDQSFSTCVRRNTAVALGTLHYVKTRNIQGRTLRLMAIRRARLKPLSSSATYHERMVNGCAAARGEETDRFVGSNRPVW